MNMTQRFGMFSTPSPSIPPAVSFPDGVKVLHDCPDATIDICFVHGLTGDRESTWTAHNQPAPWPQTLLPPKLSKARVLTYGYDAYTVRASPASTNRLIDHAKNLLTDLSADRALPNASSRPLVFVAHSLGGLVCKAALLLSRNNAEPHLRCIFNHVTGIVFMGTPHKGSWMAGWAKIAASSIGLVKSTNKTLINILQTEDQLLQNIQDMFWQMIREQREGGRRLEVTCFFEELPLPMAGIVVSKESATLEGYTSISIHANHGEMVRFASEEDTGFKRLLGELVRWESQLAPEPLDEGSKKELLDSLRFDEIYTRYNIIKQEHAETCKWLLKNPDYLNWLDIGKLKEHHGLLWVKGNPGAGKSTLMKFALDKAKKTMKNKTIISFFFNARGVDLEKSTIGMYRSLLVQLLEKLPNLSDSLDPAIWKGFLHQWTVESLELLFGRAVQGLGKSTVVCFIDALDECDENQIRDMISFFEKIGKLTTSAGIIFQVCFASRHYPYVTISKAASLNLEEQDGHDQDIVNYLKSELKIGDSPLAHEIRAEIKEKACGVFLWVALVIGILNKAYDGGRIHLLREKLREIPTDLHELFRDMLTRDCHDTAELVACIQWVLFARHPLKPKQLYIAIITRTAPHVLSTPDVSQITDSQVQRFILSSSKGLAEVTRSTRNPTVQFIHQSVRDFLLKQSSLEGIWSDLGVNFPGKSHDQLKWDCGRYMALSLPSLNTSYLFQDLPSQEFDDARQSVDKAFPFLAYAVQNILYHADAAEGCGVSQMDFLEKFSLPTWIGLDNIFIKFKIRRHTLKASGLYLLAEYNMSHLISCHPHKLSGFEVEAERYGLPIFAALATGSYDAVRVLLKTVADTVSEEWPIHDLCQQYLEIENRPTAFCRQFTFSQQHGILYHFEKNRDEIIAAALYVSGSFDVESKDPEGRTLLSWAAEKGFETVVQQLVVDSRVDLKTMDKIGRTPLAYAVIEGDEAMVKLLLGVGDVDPNAAGDGTSEAPLFHAIKRDNMAIIRQLVEDCRIDLNVRDGAENTPLLCATNAGNEAVVQLLLETGKVNVDAKDYLGFTALCNAGMGHYKKIESLLLEVGKANLETGCAAVMRERGLSGDWWT